MPVNTTNTIPQTNVNPAVTVNNQPQTKPAQKKPISNKALGATLVGLTALAAVGIYLATKGKCKVKPQNITENNAVNKFETIINEFKGKHAEFADVEPQITTLKNGRTKIEFKRHDERMGRHERNMIVLNKDGKTDRNIQFLNYDNGTMREYFVTDGSGRPIKQFKAIKKKDIVDGYNIEQTKTTIKRQADNYKDGVFWERNITTTKSDNFIQVRRDAEAIPFKEEPRDSNVITTVKLDANKKPVLVHQKFVPNIEGQKKGDYVFKPGKDQIKTEVHKNPFREGFSTLEEYEKSEHFAVVNANL